MGWYSKRSHYRWLVCYRRYSISNNIHDPDDVTVFTGSAAYVDPGATAYDASYGNKTIYGTGTTVNTLISGTYPLEYKAPDDDAGNTGQIVIRTVTVMPKPFEFIRSLGVYEGPSLNHTTVNDATDNVHSSGLYTNK